MQAHLGRLLNPPTATLHPYQPYTPCGEYLNPPSPTLHICSNAAQISVSSGKASSTWINHFQYFLYQYPNPMQQILIQAYHVKYSINQSCSLANLNPRGISVIMLFRGSFVTYATTQATSVIFSSFMQFGSTI